MTDKIDHVTPIAELFARDPLDLAKQDIQKIIEVLRAKRKRFKAGDKTAGRTTPTKSSIAQAKAQEVTGKLDLDDLGL